LLSSIDYLLSAIDSVKIVLLLALVLEQEAEHDDEHEDERSFS